MKRSDKQYNKEVSAYKWFVVVNGKVVSGFEFKTDANDLKKDFDEFNVKVEPLKSFKVDPRLKWYVKDK
jgi:hypothetical protein